MGRQTRLIDGADLILGNEVAAPGDKQYLSHRPWRSACIGAAAASTRHMDLLMSRAIDA
jgi:hypothetical protein